MTNKLKQLESMVNRIESLHKTSEFKERMNERRELGIVEHLGENHPVPSGYEKSIDKLSKVALKYFEAESELVPPLI